MIGAADALQLQGDIVFVIDESGSMANEINDIRSNVNMIFSTLQSKGDFAAGLVGFAASSHANPDIHSKVTKDPAIFLASLNSLVVDGFFEPGFDAVVLATNKSQLGLRVHIPYPQLLQILI